jgi:signal transduction histidine kinase/DNA-binding response OmpR family regulator
MKLNRLSQSFSYLSAIKQKLKTKTTEGIPLKMLLFAPFILQIFIVVGLVGWLSFRNGQRAVDKFADRLRTELVDEVEYLLEDSLLAPQQIDRLNLQAFELGLIDFNNADLVKSKFFQQLQIFDVNHIYFASTTGKFFQVSRDIDGSFLWDVSAATEDKGQSNTINRYSLAENGKIDRLLKTYQFDPRQSKWYKEATNVEEKERKTSSIVSNKENPEELYISFNYPLYDRGKLIGTIGVSHSLRSISEHLQATNESESGEVFIIEPGGDLIASSDPEKLTQTTSEGNIRVSMLNSRNPLIQATGKFLQKQFSDFQQIETTQKLQFTFNNEKQFVEVRPWQDQTGLNCLLVVTIPASDFMGEMRVDRTVTIAICALAVGIATVTTMLTSTLITRPIRRLGELSRSIALQKTMIGLEDHLSKQLSFNNIHEVRLLYHSFNDMVLQLQESIEQLEIRIEERTSELSKAKEIAEFANRSKSDFLTNMSHEVRTPLNAILGFCQLMQRDDSLKREQKDNLEIIVRSGEHLLSLINDVLDLSKIEAGRYSLWENDFDLYGLINSISGMLMLRAETKGLNVWFEIDPNTPQYVRADEKKLRQVLINLLGNSIKFTEQGKIVLKVRTMAAETISLVSDVEVLEFSIEDTGMGIAPEEIDLLFEPFTQSKSGRESQQGTGLGLSLTKQFVRIMDGDINVRSQVNQGSCFTFHIPIQISDSPQVAPTSESRRVLKLQPNQPNYRILVVDDRWENRQLMLQLLRSVGFDVKSAENGKEAVAIWDSWEPQLIWMDMRMPVMNGYEAVEAIRSHVKGQATTIIALTASTFEEERILILSAGCDDFVRKPFLESTIFEKMQFHLGVQYIYEDSCITATAPTLLELNEETLEVMPVDWLFNLQQAATELDREKIERLLESMPPERETIQRAIVQLMNDFEYDRLIFYVKGAIAKAAPLPIDQQNLTVG